MSNSTVITLRIKTDLYNEVKAVAEKEDIPASFVIRRAIKRGLAMPHTSTKPTQPVQKIAEFNEEWE